MKASIVALVGAAAVASAHNHNGTVPWTTSTVTQTRTSTISECAPTVTNCPYKKHPVTTVVVDVYTTYCPVSGSETGPTSTSTPAAPWSTSTVYETETLTISKCAPTVTNCPYTTAPITITTSSAVSTTVCPPETTSPVIVVPPVSSVSAAESSGPVTVVPPPMSLTTVSPPASETDVTITISSCPPSSVSGAITGTGSPLPTTSTLPFTGGASAQKAGGLLMAVGVVAALL